MTSDARNLRYHADDPLYQGDYEFQLPATDDPIRSFVNAQVPRGQGHCIEIGCSPGGFLTLFGDRGYTLHGIDFDPRIQEQLPGRFRALGYTPGEFYTADFTTFEFPRSYDVVYSLGFIEHFTNWVDILVRHAELVVPGGLILVGVPNYAGIVQRVLHKLFEEDNYRTHVTAAMYPDLWRLVLESVGYEVVHAGPIGAFDLWTRGTEALPRITQELAWTISSLKPTLKRIEDTKAFASAAYLAAVARRRQTDPPRELLARPSTRAGLDEALARLAEQDSRMERAADEIVAGLREFLHRRAQPSAALKDVVRSAIGRR